MILFHSDSVVALDSAELYPFPSAQSASLNWLGIAPGHFSLYRKRMNTFVVEYDPDMDEDEIDAEVAEILWLINERVLGGSSKKVMAVALSFAMKEYLQNSEAFGMHH